MLRFSVCAGVRSVRTACTKPAMRRAVPAASWRSFASRPSLLSEDERKAMLPDLKEWSMVEGRDAICRQYLFDDFKKAFAFMTRVAEYADEVDHHPEWFNVYNRVEVTLSTHDCGGLSQNDVDLARVMDNAAESFIAKE